jgi:hypothetical protein
MNDKLKRPRLAPGEYLEPANSIMAKFGGPAKVAELVAVGPVAAYLWRFPRERNGTGGLIPQKYHRLLLEAAKLRRIPLSAEDFLPRPVD